MTANAMKKHFWGIAFGPIAGSVLIAAVMAGCGANANDSGSHASSTTATPMAPAAAAGVVVTLTGSDTETCELIFAASDPINGTLGEIVDQPCVQGSPNTDSATVTFTADPGVCGSAQGSFSYTTSDGSATSAPATVTIDIPCIEVGTGEQ